MGLRIEVESVNAKKRISIAGELVAEGVPELEQVSGANGESLELDLSDLRFADSDGVQALRRMIDDGATTIGASTIGSWSSGGFSRLPRERVPLSHRTSDTPRAA